jgi:D-sedoheptulose 7-phosphate isomerase
VNESEARRLFELRSGPASELAGQADAVAAACHAMAVRFHRGGKLVVFGTTVTGIAERDGTSEIFAHQLRYVAGPDDIALGIATDGDSPSVVAGLETARELGLLTVALAGGDGGQRVGKVADHVLVAGSSDPRVVKEMHVTLYHVLWELVHVFFEQPGVLGPGVVT